MLASYSFAQIHKAGMCYCAAFDVCCCGMCVVWFVVLCFVACSATSERLAKAGMGLFYFPVSLLGGRITFRLAFHSAFSLPVMSSMGFMSTQLFLYHLHASGSLLYPIWMAWVLKFGAWPPPSMGRVKLITPCLCCRCFFEYFPEAACS